MVPNVVRRSQSEMELTKLRSAADQNVCASANSQDVDVQIMETPKDDGKLHYTGHPRKTVVFESPSSVQM